MKGRPALFPSSFRSVLSWPRQAGVRSEAAVSARRRGGSHTRACLLTAQEGIPPFACRVAEILTQNKSSGLNRASDRGERNGVRCSPWFVRENAPLRRLNPPGCVGWAGGSAGAWEWGKFRS